MIDADSRRRLVDLARDAIAAHVHGRPAPVVPIEGALGRAAGAFVTVRVGRDLRGCIGHVEAEEAVAHVVRRVAVAACSEDPRFAAVTVRDLDGLAVEISVLGPLASISGPSDVHIGRDGLVVEEGRRRGLLLPQVAVEHGWSAEVFLSQTCAKAGLPHDAWRTGARCWRFEAEVFGDDY